MIESQAWDTHPYVPGLNLVPKNEGAPVQAGDTMFLRSGYHGSIQAVEYYNSAPITICNQQGHVPEWGRLEVRLGSNWIVRGLIISPELAPTYVRDTLIELASHSWTGPVSDCVVQACRAYLVADSSNWTMEDWNNLACNGMLARMSIILVRTCYFFF